MLAIVIPVNPLVGPAMNVAEQALNAIAPEIRQSFPSAFDQLFDAATASVAYQAFPGETNQVKVYGSLANLLLMFDESTENTLFRVPPAFHRDLLDFNVNVAGSVDGGFSLGVELTGGIEITFEDLPSSLVKNLYDIADARAIVPNGAAMVDLIPGLGGVVDTFANFLDFELPDLQLPSIELPELRIPQLDFPGLTIPGFSILGKDFGPWTIWDEFTLLGETTVFPGFTLEFPSVSDLGIPRSIRDMVGLLPAEIGDFVTSIDAAVNFFRDSITTSSVYISTLDGHDTIDFSELTGIPVVVYAGGDDDTIIPGGSRPLLDTLGFPFFGDRSMVEHRLYGEAGRDTFLINTRYDSLLYIDGGPGNDRIVVEGTEGNDIFRLVAGPNGTLEKIVLEAPNPSPVATNERVLVTVPQGTIGGTFTLTFDNGTDAPATTAPIGFDVPAAELQDHLAALATVGPGNVLVGGPAGGPWEVEFVGALAARDLRVLTADGTDLLRTPQQLFVDVTTDADSTSGTNQQQTVRLPAGTTGGTFRLSFAGESTGDLAHNASRFTVQSALEGLGTIGEGNIRVSGPAGGPWIAEFSGDLGLTDQPLLAADGSGLTGGIAMEVAETVAAVASTNEVQRLELPAGVSGGTFRLSFDGQTTVPIDHDASVSDVANALWSLGSIGGVQNLDVRGSAGGPWEFEFTGALRGTDQPPIAADLSQLSGALPLQVEETVPGSGTNEVQTITRPGGVTGGSFRLTFDNGTIARTTAPLPHDATAGEVQAALEALTSVGGFPNVQVSGAPGGPWTVEFTGDLAAQNVLPIAADFTGLVGPALEPGVLRLVAGSAVENEAQSIVPHPEAGGGSFTLTFAGATTGAIPFHATAAELQAALEALPTIGMGNVLVTGGSGAAWAVEFIAALGNSPQPLLVADGAGVTFSPTQPADETVPGVAGANEVQTLTMPPTANGGSFTLSFQGRTTVAIPYDATAEQVQTALQDLSTIGGPEQVHVSGPNGGPWTVEFTGLLAGANQPLLTADTSQVSGGFADITATTIQTADAGVDEEQTLQLSSAPADGTFTLTFRRGAVIRTTDPIPFDATAAQVTAALEALSNVGPGNVAVDKVDAVTWRVTFTGDLRATGQFALQPDTAQLARGIDPTVQETRPAGRVNQVQTVTLPGVPLAGSFTLAFDDDTEVRTTVPIPYDATADLVQSALEALANLGAGGVSVTGPAGGPWDVEFIGPFAETDQAPLIGDVADLIVVGSDPEVDQIVVGSDGENLVIRTTHFSGIVNVEQLQIEGLGGDDVLIIDNRQGPIHFPLGINFNGGDGTDRLVLLGGEAVAESTHYFTGPGEATGSVITRFGDAPEQVQIVNFEQLDPTLDYVVDLVPSRALTVVGTAAATAITIGPESYMGTPVTSLSVDDYASLLFANKETLTVRAGGGDDAITVDLGGVLPELTQVTIDGEGFTGGNSLLLLGTAGDDHFTVRPTGRDTGFVEIGGVVTLDIELVSVQSLRIDGRGEDVGDSLHVIVNDAVVMPGIHPGEGEVTGRDLRGRRLLPVSYVDIEAAAQVTGNIMEITGTHGNDVFLVEDGLVRVIDLLNGERVFDVSGVNGLILDLLGGNDTVAVRPGDYFPLGLWIHGGGSDSVVVAADTEPVRLDVGTGLLGGFFVGEILLDGVENLTVNGSDGAVDRFEVRGYGQPTGLRRVTLDGGDADGDDGDILDVLLTAGPDLVRFTPTGPASARLTHGQSDLQIRVEGFNSDPGAIRIDGGGSINGLVYEGSIGSDLFTVAPAAPGEARIGLAAAGQPWVPVDAANFTEVRLEGGGGIDHFEIAPLADTVVTADGGPPAVSESLHVVDPIGGSPIVLRQSLVPGAGSVTVGALAPVFYENVEVFDERLRVDPQLLVLKPDPYEPNDTLATATYVGAGQTLNVDPTIDPAGDVDYYRFVAAETGTLDFQVYFQHVHGNLDVEVLDAAGNVIGESRSFTDNERVTIGAVADQTYYLRVFGATGTEVNVYQFSVVNAPAPVPFQVDLRAASDSGRSDADNVTGETSPTFDIFVDDERIRALTNLELIPDESDDQLRDGDFGVEFYNNGVFLGLAAYAGPEDALDAHRWRFTAEPGQLLEGHDNFITAALWIRDRATPAVVGRGGFSPPLQVTLDTTPPPVRILGIDPATGDSGVPGLAETFVDRVTNNTATAFVGGAEADAVVRLYVDAVADGAIGNPDEYGLTVALPFDGNAAFPDGAWQAAFPRDLNDPDFFPYDGLREILVTAEDPAGNVSEPVAFEIFLDTQGPRVTAVAVTNSDYDLFGKKGTDGRLRPTPLVHSLSIDVLDYPPRAPGFLYDALPDGGPTLNPGNYQLRGDATGLVPIKSVGYEGDPVLSGQPATGTIVLEFFEPLPDDRFTLTVSDVLVDPAGNRLDGETNAAEPQETPHLPSGDGVPGGDFVARFTVDSRPELAVWAAGSVYVDTNGNRLFDPANPDATNRDLVYTLGYTTDFLFAGNFALPGETADGFDKLAAYGTAGSQFRWLIDTTNDGVPNLVVDDPARVTGQPVAGDFDGNEATGDQVGLFTGTTWHLDTTGDYRVNFTLPSELRGYPIVGDFDGDGHVDLATWKDGVFYFDLTNGTPQGWNGKVDATIEFGFIGARVRPVAADMDQDGIDDVGLWVPDRAGMPDTTGEWYFLISDDHQRYDDEGNPLPQKRRPGTVVTLDHAFSPAPLGQDLFARFGSEFAVPLVGNFDPPVLGGPGQPSNPDEPEGGKKSVESAVTIHLTIRPTSSIPAGSSGAVAMLPQSPAWIDGWTTFNAEIWVKWDDDGADGIVNAATATLNYNPEYFNPTEVTFGAEFTDGAYSFDHQAGRVVGIGGLAGGDHVGKNEYALLARVAFEPRDDQLAPLVLAPDHIFAGPYDLGLSLEAVEVTLGHGPGSPVIAPPPETELWAMIYHHFSAEPRIGVPELLAVVRAFNEPITPESPPEHRWADFDRSGHVGVPDLLAIVRNFGLERPTNAITYPSNFPAAWRLEEAGDEGNVLAGFAATEAELSAGGTLSRSAGASLALAVDEYRPEETAGVGAVSALAAPGTMAEEPADGRNGAAAERTGWYLAERYREAWNPGRSRDIGPQPPETFEGSITADGRTILLEAALAEALTWAPGAGQGGDEFASSPRTWLLDAASEPTSLIHDPPMIGQVVDSALESLFEEDALHSLY